MTRPAQESPSWIFRRAVVYVHFILKGAKLAELPVERPTRFYLMVNLTTTKALGIAFPPPILCVMPS